MQENLGDYSEGGFGEGDYGENPESFHSGHSRTEEDDTEPEDVTEVGDEDYEGDDKQADGMRVVEDMVEDVQDGMDEALVENPELRKSLQKSLEEIKKAVSNADPNLLDDVVNEVVDCLGPKSGKKSFMDSKVLVELQEAERQAQQTAIIITDLKQSVAQLLCKPHMTDLENIELEQKNKQLACLLQDFEQRTRQIQLIVGHIDQKANALLPSRMSAALAASKRPCPKPCPKDEDMLPKVIICGTTENNMPKIIICDADKKKRQNKASTSSSFAVPQGPANAMPQFARRLNESYNMQERLAAENADLEGKRYQLQEEILNKDQTVECLRQKVNCLQSELRVVVKENTILSSKLNKSGCETSPFESNKNKINQTQNPRGGNMAGCPGKGVCPGDVESRLQNYSNTTNILEKQLGEMEAQVKSMQCELETVQRERMMLEQQRKSGASSCKCGPGSIAQGGQLTGTGPKAICSGPCNQTRQQVTNGSISQGQFNSIQANSIQCNNQYPDQHLKELREQYCQLQQDYKNKLSEVAQLRADSEFLKQALTDAELNKEQACGLLKDKEREARMLQLELSKITGNKEMRVEQEQQLALAKQKLRDACDELDELRAIVGDQTTQLDDYRNKYLQAQQCVEEQRRQIDVMEMENQRVSDQVNMEIQRVKCQFQEKLQELTPLPDILKATQLKLQEAQQLQLIAERNAEKVDLELQRSKDKELALCAEIDKFRHDSVSSAESSQNFQKQLRFNEKKFEDLKNENESLKNELCRLEDFNAQNEKRFDEKQHEVAQLNSQLEQLREESARQVARAKERTDTVRRSLQNQISDMERQLAQTRASCRSAQKERDDIRQKMQCQINNLNDNFEQAQSRIRSLQGHVNYLKTSYSSMFIEGDGSQIDGGNCPCSPVS